MEQQESGGAGGQIRMMCFKWGAKKYEHLKISFDLLTLHDNKRLVLLVAPYDKVLYISCLLQIQNLDAGGPWGRAATVVCGWRNYLLDIELRRFRNTFVVCSCKQDVKQESIQCKG